MSERQYFEARINRSIEIIKTVRAAFGYATVFGIFFFAIDAFRAIALNAPQEIINLAKVAEAVSLDRIFLGGLSIVSGVAWRYERNGKKRAIREKSRLQQKIEENDPERSSSGLTESGDTPED